MTAHFALHCWWRTS
ncbi:trp operon leader peptide [Enterobacter hormaechei]